MSKKWYSPINILYLLSTILVILQLLLRFAISASAANSGYQFGNSAALDKASVSVVRLVAGYTTASPVAGCPSNMTGLGVLVGSWATSQGSKDFSNWILTDGAIINPQGISCGAGKPTELLSSIQIYLNDAYTSGTPARILKSLQCHATSCSDGPATEVIICQVQNACEKGTVLLPFHTTAPEPFIDLAQVDQATPASFGIELAGSPPLPVSPGQAPQLLEPMQVSQGDPRSERGMPIVNSGGQLLDMNTKEIQTGQAIREFVTRLLAPAPIKAQNTNTLQANWNQGITDFYAGDFVTAQSDFTRAGAANAQFQAPVAFMKLPQFGAIVTTPTPGASGTPSSSTTRSGPSAIPDAVFAWFPWIIVAAMLLLAILVLVIVMVIRSQMRHSRGLAAFEKERAAADQKAAQEVQRQQAQQAQQQAAINARHITETEQLAVEKQQQPVPPPVTYINPAVNVAQENYTSSLTGPLCPHCHQPILTNAAFCTSCGFSPYPLAGFHTSSTVLPANYADALLPASLPSVQPPHESAQEQVRVDRQKDENALGRVGQRLGNYHLIRLLGEGAFAEVYLGEHIHLGSLAAIKVLHNQLTSDGRERFLVEARTLVRLVHPHIVRILDFGIEDKTAFLVMDFAANGTLRERHPNGTRLSLTMANSYVQQLADALQFAHNQKIIHRDIKPENMLVGQQNTLLLSDFGMATIVMSSRYQNVQDMGGTIAYMAPEQIQSHPRPASDQYALGVVVYEWLCGTRPFHGSFTEIAAKHAMASPPPLRIYVPELPTVVEEVVLRALAKDPGDRFTNVQTFAQALAQAR